MVPTALKYGWTTFIGGKKLWSGWGWRHVAAKHGWETDDIVATTAALATVPVPEGSSLVYRGPQYERNGAICERRVVVAPASSPDEPEAKEIITSYGRDLGDAP